MTISIKRHTERRILQHSAKNKRHGSTHSQALQTILKAQENHIKTASNEKHLNHFSQFVIHFFFRSGAKHKVTGK